MKNFTPIVFCTFFLLFTNDLKAQCISPVALPYFNGFENDVIGQTPQCFTVQNLYSANSPDLVITDSNNLFEGSKKLLVYGASYGFTGYSYWVFLPAMYFDSSKKYYLSFQYRGYNNKVINDAPFRVYYGLNPTITAMNKFLGYTTYWPDTYTPFNAAIINATGVNYIGINYQSSPDEGNALYIDNISVAESMPSDNPICPGSNTYFVSGNSNIGNMYQWQADTGNGYLNINDNSTYNGAYADTLKLIAPATNLYGIKYRCVINGNTYTTAHTLKFAVKWTGYGSAAWDNPVNWNCGILPDENTDVIIDKIPTYSNFYPVVSNNTACGNLKLMRGVYVTVKTGIKLEVKKKN